jgi:heat shock protein HtpX
MIRALNNLKTVLLLGGLMGICLLVGSQFGQHGMLIGFLFGSLGSIISWFFSDKIAIAMMQGQEVGPNTGGLEGEIYHLVDELRQRAGLPMPKVYVCPQQAPNAFATGRSPSKAAVAVTRGALELLSLDELRGVMAHELAHVKNRDTLISCVAATIAGALAVVARMAFFFGGGNNREGGNPIAGLLALIFAPIAAVIIQAAISRSREFVADADGAKIAGSPYGLMGALKKLDALSQRIPLDSPNPAQNNMFIVEPLTGGSIFNLFASHPPTEKRLAALAKLGEEMRARGVTA